MQLDPLIGKPQVSNKMEVWEDKGSRVLIDCWFCLFQERPNTQVEKAKSKLPKLRVTLKDWATKLLDTSRMSLELWLWVESYRLIGFSRSTRRSPFYWHIFSNTSSNPSSPKHSFNLNLPGYDFIPSTLSTIPPTPSAAAATWIDPSALNYFPAGLRTKEKGRKSSFCRDRNGSPRKERNTVSSPRESSDFGGTQDSSSEINNRDSNSNQTTSNTSSPNSSDISSSTSTLPQTPSESDHHKKQVNCPATSAFKEISDSTHGSKMYYFRREVQNLGLKIRFGVHDVKKKLHWEVRHPLNHPKQSLGFKPSSLHQFSILSSHLLFSSVIPHCSFFLSWPSIAPFFLFISFSVTMYSTSNSYRWLIHCHFAHISYTCLLSLLTIFLDLLPQKYKLCPTDSFLCEFVESLVLVSLVLKKQSAEPARTCQELKARKVNLIQ